MDIKKAVILAGGLGTRLRPLTLATPKPLLPVHGKSIIEHIFDHLKRYGIREATIAVSYMPDKMMDFLGDGSRYGMKIDYFIEDVPLGTAGGLRLLADKLKDTFVMVNGDILMECDMEEMYRIHKRNNAIGTLALWEVEDPSSFGVVKLDKNRILEFVEKPKKELAPSKLINSGFYMLEPEVVKYIPEGYSMMEKDVFPKLASEGKLFGYPFKGQWFDTGTMERYQEVIKKWKDLR